VSNETFKEYVRSGAFNSSLSERQIKVLLSMRGYGPKDERLNMAPYQALARRGLIFWDDSGVKETEAGIVVSNLLVLAGYGSYNYLEDLKESDK
jgi:hypothetical protein